VIWLLDWFSRPQLERAANPNPKHNQQSKVFNQQRIDKQKSSI
jgi:hypothetical protein